MLPAGMAGSGRPPGTSRPAWTRYPGWAPAQRDHLKKGHKQRLYGWFQAG